MLLGLCVELAEIPSARSGLDPNSQVSFCVVPQFLLPMSEICYPRSSKGIPRKVGFCLFASHGEA